MTGSGFGMSGGRIRLPRRVIGAMRRLPGLAVALALAGCTNVDNAYFSSFANKSTGLDLPATVDFYPDHEVHQVAKNHFGEGQYGLAAR